uniref:Uncharacterized protein n=1 Tax=Fagus sylvatica TaxID=28930 RepID=A0A2N9F253_FAGSY
MVVTMVRNGDGVCIWVVAMGFGGWFLSPFSAVVADKMGCGGFGFTGVGVSGFWVVAVSGGSCGGRSGLGSFLMLGC